MSGEKRQYKPLLHLPISSILSSSLGTFGKLETKNGGKDIPQYFSVEKHTIRIGYHQPNIPVGIMKEAWQHIAKKVKLHHSSKSILKLGIYLDKNATNKDFERIGHEISKNFTSLRHLNINYTMHAALPEERLKYISKKTNRKLRQLQNVSINFGGWNTRQKVTLQNVAWFSRRNTSQIQQLELRQLSGEMFNDVWLAKFIPGLGDCLKTLKILSLHFSSCENITDQGINALGQGIATKFKALKELDLGFYYCKKVTLEEISLFGDNDKVQISPTLTTLSLNFSKCYDITDKGFLKLMDNIEKISHSLTDLSLRFSECHEITNVSFEKLGHHYLKNLCNLERLLLNFRCCKELRRNGLEVLATEGFKNLTKLKRLTLCFNKCERIANGGISSLSDGISQHLTQLESLAIHCWDVKTPSQQLYESIENVADKLQNLKNFNLNDLGFYRNRAGDEPIRNDELKNLIRRPNGSSYSFTSSGGEILAL